MSNAPITYGHLFGSTPATSFYRPGTSGWGPVFEGRPTAPWVFSVTPGAGFGIGPGGFGFVVTRDSDGPVVIEARTDRADSPWIPVATNTITEGWCRFGDSGWTNFPARLFRVRGY